MLAESIKKKDEILEKNVERFLKLLTTTSNALVTRSANDTRAQNQRSTKVVLPKMKDIELLNNLLDQNIDEYSQQLKNHFTVCGWVDLSKIVLLTLMIFDRKWPGDVEKTRFS